MFDIPRMRLALVALAAFGLADSVHAQQAGKPNIVVIMGDDIGWYNIAPTIRASWPAARPTSTD